MYVPVLIPHRCYSTGEGNGPMWFSRNSQTGQPAIDPRMQYCENWWSGLVPVPLTADNEEAGPTVPRTGFFNFRALHDLTPKRPLRRQRFLTMEIRVRRRGGFNGCRR